MLTNVLLAVIILLIFLLAVELKNEIHVLEEKLNVVKPEAYRPPIDNEYQELANLMAYNGTPQRGMNDED